MSSSYMAIHCLLEETLLLRYLLGLLLQGALHYRRAGRALSTCCPIGQLVADPQGPLLFMPSNKRHSSSPPTPATSSLGIWASSIHPIFVCCKNCHGNTSESTPYCVHAVTHRRDHRGHKTIPVVIQHGRTAEGTRPNPPCPGHPQEPGAASWSRIPLPSCLATGPGQLEDLRNHMRSPRLHLLLLSINTICIFAWVFLHRTHP